MFLSAYNIDYTALYEHYKVLEVCSWCIIGKGFIECVTLWFLVSTCVSKDLSVKSESGLRSCVWLIGIWREGYDLCLDQNDLLFKQLSSSANYCYTMTFMHFCQMCCETWCCWSFFSWLGLLRCFGSSLLLRCGEIFVTNLTYPKAWGDRQN